MASFVTAVNCTPGWSETIDIVLKEERPNEFRARADIPPLVAGSSSTVKLRIKNPDFNSRVKLGSPTGSCSCLSMTASKTTIDPGEEIDAEIVLKVEGKVRHPGFRQYVVFDPVVAGESSVTIDFISTIAGLLVFQDPQFSLEVTDREDADVERRLKLNFSAPVSPSNLELEIVDKPHFVQASLVKTGDDLYVNLQIDGAELKGKAARFLVRVRDKKVGDVAEIVGVVAPKPAIDVLPGIVRISRVGDESLEGQVLILREPPMPREPRDALEVDQAKDYSNTIAVTCKFQGKTCKLKKTMNSHKIARYTVKLPLEVVRDLDRNTIEKPNLHWDVVWGSDRRQVQTKVLLDEKFLDQLTRE